MRYISSRFFALPDASILILTACIVSLAFALTMQYGFDIAPCELCLIQRAPFVTAGFISIVVLMSNPSAPLTRFLIALCAFLFFVNSGVAVFHSGVERHWWEFHSACTGAALSHAKSLQDLTRELLEKPVVRCDEISWSILGFSMANFNVPFSFVLGLFSTAVAVRREG